MKIYVFVVMDADDAFNTSVQVFSTMAQAFAAAKESVDADFLWRGEGLPEPKNIEELQSCIPSSCSTAVLILERELDVALA